MSRPTSNAFHDAHHLTRKLAMELGLPVFRASGEQLQIIEEPSHFYSTLKHEIALAQSRIFLASLYIGKEETELIEELRAALARSQHLRITILVDALRSTREPAPSPSCASLVASLARDFPDRVELRLYRTPKLKKWLERIVGKRFNEGWGLQHMKIYGFDNDVIISGANLSRDYFTNRRDRYLLIRQHSQISDYLYQLVETVARFSYRLDATTSPDAEAVRTSYSDWKLTWDGGRSLPISAPASSDSLTSSSMSTWPEEGWSAAAAQTIESFTKEWQSRTERPAYDANVDTLLLPLLQMGPFGIRQETQAVPQLFELAQQASANSAKASVLDLTSGYFSLYRPYQALLTRAQRARSSIVRIICAAPESNGFFQSKGVSGWIPDAYTWFEYQFWSLLQRRSRLLRQGEREEDEGGVEIREWRKQGWTYHAKGIWYTPPPLSSPMSSATSSIPTEASEQHGKHDDGPSMVHVGSSNYGSRSSDLDLECTLLISTTSNALRKRLGEEVEGLRRDADDVVDAALFERPDRQVRRRVKIAAWFLKGML
ncbi:hypothetical protein BCV70DRAFT_197354 [Testicularia cyperi]|uniref:CDP-diacylglycerol--glycerol-3-phosphate 3-phosphatidyltransferase n=1 Tax=Testicularia cyperi TaxID=1882483 RepID=A0A317XYV1_9BASI|nr:hypothetical protein BCV70DRAFT_197354 [Testicularia cyperi]